MRIIYGDEIVKKDGWGGEFGEMLNFIKKGDCRKKMRRDKFRENALS